MVKLPDENYPKLIDHLGWRLWRAARRWKAEFDARMAAEGFAWFTEARSALLGHVGPSGVRQNDLVRRMGLTKQAVQQIVDELAAEGIVARRPDPADARGRIVVLTAAGVAAAHAANEVKRAIDAEQRERLGPERFEALIEALRAFAPDR